MGLLGLMLLHESRREARSTPEGELVLLEEQDRSLWNQDQIAEGRSLVNRALSSHRFGPYTLQAAIAAVHAEALNAASTDWAQIVGLYDILVRAIPSPVVELNRAVAVAMRDTPATGVALIDAILARGELGDYYLAHAARADLCRRQGRTEEARASYESGSRPGAAGTRAAVPQATAGRAEEQPPPETVGRRGPIAGARAVRCSVGRRPPHHVADGSHGDEITGGERVVFQFLPEPGHVGVDRATHGARVVAPHVPQQLRP